MVTAYDKAGILGSRCFYCRYTDTIRTHPENYLVATRDHITRKFSALGDAAIKHHRGRISEIIKTWENGSTAEAIADEIGKYLVKEEK